MTATATQLQTPHPKIWTKAEYLRIVELGGFDEDSNLYLFRGGVIEFPQMSWAHATSIMKITKLLFSIFDPTTNDIRIRLPLDVPGESIPEPDCMVCTCDDGRRSPYPEQAELIIEVADSSLSHDRQKALEYAAAGVREYWIVDLNRRCLEIYRNSSPDSTALLGYRYPAPTIAKAGEVITPVAVPGVSVNVNDLLP